MHVHVYARWLRPALALAVSAGWVSLLVHAAVLAVAAAEGEVQLPARAFLAGAAALTLGPWAAVWLVRAAGRGTAAVEGPALVLALPDRRIEIPVAGVASARAWRLPLPGPGVALGLASGPPPVAIEAADPGAVTGALAAAGAAGVEAGRFDAWARARAAHRPGAVERALRWGLLPLLAAGLLFRAHQVIAYGAALGEWYAAGPAAWLRTFAGYAIATWALLVLVAAAARALAEAGCALATAVLPRQAGPARLAAEWLCRAVLYAGVPALLAIRFLG